MISNGLSMIASDMVITPRFASSADMALIREGPLALKDEVIC